MTDSAPITEPERLAHLAEIWSTGDPALAERVLDRFAVTP
jgi:hypothetical protein